MRAGHRSLPPSLMKAWLVCEGWLVLLSCLCLLPWLHTLRHTLNSASFFLPLSLALLLLCFCPCLPLYISARILLFSSNYPKLFHLFVDYSGDQFFGRILKWHFNSQLFAAVSATLTRDKKKKEIILFFFLVKFQDDATTLNDLSKPPVLKLDLNFVNS